jgi:hypothetical protein
MIIESAELSAEQKAAIEALLGQSLHERDAISLRAIPAVLSASRSAGAQRVREALAEPGGEASAALNDEKEVALLEALRAERSDYTPMR